MISGFALAALVVLGGFVAAAASLPGAWSGRLASLAAAPACGFGSLGLVTFFCLSWRLPATIGFGVWASGVIALAWIRRERLRAFAAHRDTGPEAAPRWLIFLNMAAGIWLLPTLWSCAKNLPWGSHDAGVLWTGKALLFARAPEIAIDQLALVQLGMVHPEYPLLLPSALAAQLALVGESPAVAMATGFWLFVGLTASIFVWLRRFAATEIAWLGTLLWLSLPIVKSWSFAQVADPWVAYLLLWTVAGLASCWERGRPPLPGAWVGFFAGLLLFTKSEGLPLVLLALGLSAIAALGRRSAAPSRDFWRGLLVGALPGVGAGILFRWLWAPPSEIANFVAGISTRFPDPERWRTVFARFGDLAAGRGEHGLWVMFFPLLALMLVLGARGLRRRPGLILATVFLGAAVLMVATIYVLTPYNLAWHLRTSLDRLALQLLPLGLVVFLAFGATFLEQRTGATAEDALVDRDRDPISSAPSPSDPD